MPIKVPAVSLRGLLLLSLVFIVFTEIVKVALTLLFAILTTILVASYRGLSSSIPPILSRLLDIAESTYTCVCLIVDLLYHILLLILPLVVVFVLLKRRLG